MDMTNQSLINLIEELRLTNQSYTQFAHMLNMTLIINIMIS